KDKRISMGKYIYDILDVKPGLI
ncbi:uncharacterized protein METZ01_LOCUS166859, partial [marine metagenome]